MPTPARLRRCRSHATVATVGFIVRLALAVAILGSNTSAYGQETPPISTSTSVRKSSCSASYDCNIGFVCREGGCVDGRGVACKADEECAGGDACVLGICAVPAPRTAAPKIVEAAPKSCKTDRECPGDLICDAQKCIAASGPASACKTDRECPGDQICDAAVCVAPPAMCKNDRECSGDLICDAGRCSQPSNTCTADRDCPGALICDAGRCLEPQRPSAPPAATTVTTSAEAPPCKGLGGNECPRGTVCRYFRCQEPPKGSIAYEPFRIGLSSLIAFGRGGKLENTGTGFDLGADLTVSVSRVFRFHFQLGFERVNGFNGLRAAPLVMGFGIPIISAPVRFEVEIIAALVQAEVLFGDGFNLGLGSGFRIQAVVGWGPLFFGFVPAGLEVRYFALHDDTPQPGIGLGQSLVFTLGYEN